MGNRNNINNHSKGTIRTCLLHQYMYICWYWHTYYNDNYTNSLYLTQNLNESHIKSLILWQWQWAFFSTQLNLGGKRRQQSISVCSLTMGRYVLRNASLPLCWANITESMIIGWPLDAIKNDDMVETQDVWGYWWYSMAYCFSVNVF